MNIKFWSNYIEQYVSIKTNELEIDGENIKDRDTRIRDNALDEFATTLLSYSTIDKTVVRRVREQMRGD